MKVIKNFPVLFSVYLYVILTVVPGILFSQTPQQWYEKVQQDLTVGWNTWNTQSVLSHVLLPEGFALNVCMLDTRITGERYLKEAYISQKSKRPETITPGPHAYDGSYTELILNWNGNTVKVQSATENYDLVLLITPLTITARVPIIVLESGMLWNREGKITKNGQKIVADLASRSINVGSPNNQIPVSVPASAPYLAFALNEIIGIYTGKERNIAGITKIIERQKHNIDAKANAYKNLSDTYRAMQGVLAWNTIYDPSNNRVISPVSRVWNTFFGGNFVLFCWDTYFASYIAALDNKNLAYANAIEVTKGIKKYGMVPNYVSDGNLGSPDRSQPPVGSLIVREIYRKYKEPWLLEYVFDDLLTWNKWWLTHRINEGYLSWGSDSLPPPYNDDASNNWQGAAYESGLDNSPMFDKVPFNKSKHVMELADVGLLSLYITDCKALAEIAQVLGKKNESKELIQRASIFEKKLQTLWSSEKDIYLNKRTDINKSSFKLSPTNFYPLLTKFPNGSQAKKMIEKHLFNSEEFSGDFMLPSVSKNDSAFKEQNYWRGRIWGPLNMLVYLGLRNYNLPEARKLLAQKSNSLLLKTFHETGMVHENYNGITGKGRNADEKLNTSDSFYHWGGLLGLIPLIEAGYLGKPENSIVEK